MKSSVAHKSKSESALNGKAFSGHKDHGNFFSYGRATDIFFDQIQTKLTVGHAGDPYEVEADAMADKVVQRLEQGEITASPFFQAYHGNTAIQTKCAACEDEVRLNGDQWRSEATDALQRKTIVRDLHPVNAIKSANETSKTMPNGSLAPKISNERSSEPEDLLAREEDNPEEEPLKFSNCRECEESEREVMFKLNSNVLQRSPQSAARDEGSMRKRIVEIAHAELGKVEAKKTDPSGRRVGYDHLLEYFHLAAPNVWPDSVIEFKREGFPSWCGIFSVYSIKTAGIDVGNWQMGRGVSAFNSLEVTPYPKAGDIGYIDQPYQHHCIVTEVVGDTIKSIDGNSGWYSEVIEKTRPRSQFSGFFTPFTGRQKYIQKKENENLSTPTEQDITSQLNNRRGKGAPMDRETSGQMESSFTADFSKVRIHTGSEAVAMSKSLNAQAFTHGGDIYFNEGRYNPASHSGKHLLAHELTHTLQQGSAVHQKPDSVSEAPAMVQGFGVLDLIPDWIIENARQIPGYTLFTVIIEYDPLKDRNVERTPVNLLEGLMGLVPFGTAIFDKLKEYGIIQRVFDWVSGQLNSLNLTSRGLLDLVEEAWDELEIPYTNAIEVITRKFQRLLNRIESFAMSLVDQIITWIKEALIDVAEPILEDNRAWSLIKKIIRYDPLRDREVEATTVEILEDFLILIDRQTELEQMKERGTLQETADWLDTQVGTFMSLIGELRGLITALWDLIQPSNLPQIAENLQKLAGQVTGFLQRVWDFAVTVATQVLELIKNSLLGWLNSFAADIPGFTLLTVILERNPLTDEEVRRTVENIIRGFMGLVPGGEAKYQELKQSGVIPRAAAQIEALIEELGFSLATIVQLFTDIWNILSIEDLIDPIDAFERIAAQFGEPISRLFTFVVKVVRVLVELILEIMGIPPDMIASIIANAMQAFEDIKKDPIRFLLNLMNAVKEGFLKFLHNIGTHLLNGLQNWLFGTLADAGIQIPSDFSLRSILGLAMELLGITVDNILDRLALKIGEEKVAQIRSVMDKLSGLWGFIRDVMERGPIAIWEYIQSQVSNLWNVIKEGIMGYIQEKVIQQAISWLLSFLDVTGIMPVIRGVQTVFNAISSFIEKLREILGIVNSFVAGVAEIARGSIQTAAAFLETALADGIPVAISFLAKQLGLGDISEKIQEMVENARGMINEGIDWLIDRALAAGTAFLGMLGLGGSTREGADEAQTEAESSLLPPVDVDIDVEIGSETHEVRNAGESDRLVMHSTPTLLNEHPSAEVKAAYSTYLTEISEATSVTAKKNAANSNLLIIASKIKEYGDPDAPGASAPGIGTVDKHKNQQNRMRKSGIPVWFTESEHVIPRAFINAAFEVLAQAGVPAGSADYNDMHTILIYKGAADIKTDAPFGDQSTINDFKKTMVELLVEVFGVAQANPAEARSEMVAAVFRLLSAFASDAKGRTNSAISEENEEHGEARGPTGSKEPPTPNSGQVNTAFIRQKADAQNQLQVRINQFIAERASNPALPDLSENQVQRSRNTANFDNNEAGSKASPAWADELDISKSGGKPLPEATKSDMETVFGADFSSVSVHTGEPAAQLSREINARAFTHGSDIYFNKGEYQPGTSTGKHLLAHELTHTVQQGRTVRPKFVQKAEDTQELKPPKGVVPLNEGNGEFTFRMGNLVSSFSQGTLNELGLPILRLPKFKIRNAKLIKYPFLISSSLNLPTNEEELAAETARQREIWKKYIHESAQLKLKSKLEEAHINGGYSRAENPENRIYFFKGKKRSSLYVFGTENQLLDVTKIPSWDEKENPALFQVDHVLETQLGGSNMVRNYELLEGSANASSGSRIMWEMNKMIKQLYDVLDSPYYQDPSRTERPTLPPRPKRANQYVNLFLNAKYNIKFQASEFALPTEGSPHQYWSFRQINQGEHLNKIDPMTGDEVRKMGSEDDPALFISSTGGKKLPIPKGDQYPVKNWAKMDRIHLLSRPDFQNLQLSVDAYRVGNDQKIRASYPQMTWYLEKIPGIYGFYVNKEKTIKNAIDDNRGVFQSLGLPGMSPVKINNLDLSERGFYGVGKVLPTIPFLKDADIDIIIDGDGIRMAKTFATEEIKFPDPFKVTSTSLEVAFGTKGLTVSGDMDFGIANVGEGHIKAKIDQRGTIKLAGGFKMASELFDKSELTFGYERGDEGEGKYSFGGVLRLGKGKVRGLKKAEAEVQYADGQLFAKGMAQLDIKGFDEIEMYLNIRKDGYSFGGKIAMGGVVPMIKKGDLELNVTDDKQGGFQVSGGGTVEPDIPGLKSGTVITIAYNDGAILIQGKVPFSLGQTKAEGEISVGITNQKVDENNEPTGAISSEWTVFGKGNVSVGLSKGIAAAAEVVLEPNGDIIVSGKVGLDHSKSKASDREIELLNEELFKIGPTSVVLFAIPPIGASLKLGIEGGANAYAYITPPHIKELAIGLENFNLTNPDDNFEIQGEIAIGMTGRGGLAAYLTLKATLSVLVAAVEGRLTGSIGLEARGAATASVKAKWSRANGLVIEQGKLEFYADARFMAKLTGGIRVFLDLWLAEIKIWEEDLDIASIEFGPALNTGFELPISMEDGELKPGEFNKDALKIPDISSPQKQEELVKEGASQDEKVKPPPPPSKEEANQAVARLDAGPVQAWDIMTMDADEARARVALKWISRDTYIIWLKMKHSKIDWGEAVAIGRQKDRADFNSFRMKFLEKEVALFEKMSRINAFGDAHHLFSKAHGAELLALMKEKRPAAKDPDTGGGTVSGPVHRSPLATFDEPADPQVRNRPEENLSFPEIPSIGTGSQGSVTGELSEAVQEKSGPGDPFKKMDYAEDEAGIATG